MEVTRNELGATDAVMDLIFSAIEHAIESVREGGDLVPFRLALTMDGQRPLDRYAFESIDASRAALLDETRKLSSETIAYAVAVEGYITIEGHKFSAILVEAADREMQNAVHFMQRFRPVRGDVPFAKIGGVSYLGETPNLFRPAA